MTRTRHVGWIVAASTLAVVSACGGGGGSGDSSAKGPGGWSRAYDGTQLNVIAEATANSQILEKMLPDFEKRTGIHVSLQQAPYDSLVQKAVLDFSTKKGNYDVLSIPYEYLGSFAEKKYIEPQDGFVSKTPAGVGDGFATSDIVPALWKASSKWKSHWYGMPSNSAIMMMMYRKDLMADPAEKAAFKAKYGYDLAPAKTWTQYRDIAEFFTRKAGEKLGGQSLGDPFYGVALAGKRHVATVLEWMNYSWTYGGDIFDSSGEPALDSPENVAALDFEHGLTKFAPPGYTSATWDEVTAELQQGIAAESITWGDTAGAMEDPSQSKVKGKMGYTAIPTLKAGDTPEAHLGSWTWSVNAASKNQDAAQLFMAWALSKPVQQKLATGGGLPALTSTFEDAQLKSQLPYWTQELSSLQQAKSRPRIPQWGGISDALGLEISQVLAGQKSAQDGLDSAQSKVKSLMGNDLPVTYQ